MLNIELQLKCGNFIGYTKGSYKKQSS